LIASNCGKVLSLARGKEEKEKKVAVTKKYKRTYIRKKRGRKEMEQVRDWRLRKDIGSY